MTISEIQNSGLLELYAIGEITPLEREIVVNALAKSEELRSELSSIEESLTKFANILAIDPSPEIKSKLLSQTNVNSPQHNEETRDNTNKSSILRWLLLLSCIGLIGAFFMSQSENKKLQNQNKRNLITFDSITKAKDAQISLLENIRNKNNRIIEFKATEKHPLADLYFHYNPILKKNFIQIKNLPNIASNESFQLWALKDEKKPIPLDVFENSEQNLFEVSFVNAPDAYAITIEPKGGKESPTLENLVGTIEII